VTFTPFGGGGAAAEADGVARAVFAAALDEELVALSDEEQPAIEAKAIAASHAIPVGTCEFVEERASIRVAKVAVSIFGLRM
jgi:hypothetical protein